ncbi:MAG TPA: hypothetical protein H9829_07120 [Candidatus Tetragenococcus pullicola]|nr:hypothetical protein [Candidatus Tetragenococcus pullicola]
MRGYLTLFKLRMNAGLQYRGAALSGIVTQLVWGFLLITLFQLMGQNTMPAEEIATYFWLNQAFIAMNAIWTMDGSLFQEIETGNIQYAVLRPQNIYFQWFVRNGAYRLSRTILRAIPLFFIVFLLPKPYRMGFPASGTFFISFILSLILAFFTQLAIGNIMVSLVMKSKQIMGVRILFISLFDFLDGGNIPYAYFPPVLQTILTTTFFYSIKTAPFLMYMGSIPILSTLFFQFIWLIILMFVGYKMVSSELRKLEVYGG